MLALLGLIPGAMSLISSVTAAVFNAKVQIEMAQTGAARDVAVANIQASTSRLQAIAGSRLLTLLVISFAAPLVLYVWKVVAFDIVVGSLFGCYGSHDAAQVCGWFATDPIRGQVADWATTIIASIFGSTAALGIVSAFRSK